MIPQKDMIDSEIPKSKAVAPLIWFFELTIRQAWRLLIAIVGGTILLIGVIMIVTPGPATLLIPTGLGILALEFMWARKMLRRAKVQARWQLRKLRQRKKRESD